MTARKCLRYSTLLLRISAKAPFCRPSGDLLVPTFVYPVKTSGNRRTAGRRIPGTNGGARTGLFPARQEVKVIWADHIELWKGEGECDTNSR